MILCFFFFFCNWLIIEEAEDELTDFRIWFFILGKNSKVCSHGFSSLHNHIHCTVSKLFNKFQDISQRDSIETKKGTSARKRSDSKSVTLEALEDDIRRLQLQYKNLVSEKSCQVTALVEENKFAWNQFNVLDSQYTDKLNTKQSELDKANKRIEALMSDMVQLRSSNAEKDEIIERLKAELSRKKADASRLQQVSRTSGERKSRSASCTPVIKRCAAGGRTSVMGGKNSGGDPCNITVKKENSAPRVPDLQKENEKVLVDVSLLAEHVYMLIA